MWTVENASIGKIRMIICHDFIAPVFHSVNLGLFFHRKFLYIVQLLILCPAPFLTNSLLWTVFRMCNILRHLCRLHQFLTCLIFTFLANGGAWQASPLLLRSLLVLLESKMETSWDSSHCSWHVIWEGAQMVLHPKDTSAFAKTVIFYVTNSQFTEGVWCLGIWA